MFYVLEGFHDVEQMLTKWVDEVYPIYKAEDIELFNKRVMKMSQVINQGKLTKKQKSKAFSVYNSLKILERLDEDYCEHFINKFMSAGDFSSNSEDGILTF
jgi:hypothetical protein